MDKTDAKLKALEKQIKATYTKAYQEMKKEASDILAKIEVNPEMPLAQKMALMTKYDRLNTLSTQLANTAYNANTMAQKMINNEMVNVYDINYNGDAERLGFGLIDHTAIKKVLKQEENPFNMISSLRDKEGIRNQMKGQLLSGLLKGESMQKIARRLKDVSEKSLKDSIRIARTETTRVQNSAKMDIGKEGQRLGFEMWKRWVATTDGRVREDHLAMDGVEVPQDEPFVLPDGSKMMFPGDISLGADASQVINCRCTMIEFMKEKPVDEQQVDVGRFREIGIEEKQVSKLQDGLSALPDSEKKVWQDTIKQTKYKIASDEDVSYFKNGEITLHKEDTAQTVLHETAHAIDKNAVNIRVGGDDWGYTITDASRYVEELMDYDKEGLDLEAFADTIGVKLEDGWFGDKGEVFEKYNDWMKGLVKEYDFDREDLSLLSDIFSGMTQDTIGASYIWGGHDKSYWMQPATRGNALMKHTEAWADYCALRATKNEKLLGILEKTAPNLSKSLEKVYNEVFK